MKKRDKCGKPMNTHLDGGDMKIYIASSWKNQHAVQMLTDELRKIGCQVFSFVENNFEECHGFNQEFNFYEWVWSEKGSKAFEYDTQNAMNADTLVYIGPSGIDAWAEVGAAYAKGVNIVGLYAKDEGVGLMRRMMGKWFNDYMELLRYIKAKKEEESNDNATPVE